MPSPQVRVLSSSLIDRDWVIDSTALTLDEVSQQPSSP